MSRWMGGFAVVVLTVAVCAVADQTDTAAVGRWRVGVVGDSLTWYAANACGERADITSSGFPVVGIDGKIGRTMAGGRSAWQPSWGANVAVLGLGTNDTRLWNDPARWRTSIRSVLARVGPNTKIVWVNVWRWDGPSFDRARGQRLAAQFNQILAQELHKLGGRAMVADWAAMASTHREWTVGDGIHDTLAGCRNRIRLITSTLHRLMDPPPPTTTWPPTTTSRPTTTTAPSTSTSTTMPPTTTSTPATNTTATDFDVVSTLAVQSG